MKVAVKDANVLIDLVEGDLLGLWFRLGIETHVPDLVLEEIKNPGQRSVASKANDKIADVVVSAQPRLPARRFGRSLGAALLTSARCWSRHPFRP